MNKREMILSQDYAEIIYPAFTPDEDILQRYNASFFQPIDTQLSTLYIKREEMKPLTFSNYSYAMFPKLYGLMQSSPLDEAGITAVMNQSVLSLQGQGVLIGIVDTGIDFMNPAFIDEDGFTKIVRIWDQSTNEGRPPQAFKDEELAGQLNLRLEFGSEYTSEDINNAIRSENPYEVVKHRDTNGHGTYLAGVMASAAPKAKFVIVKLKEAKQYLKDYYLIRDGSIAYQENDIIAGAGYTKAYGQLYGMPLSLLIALGSSQGEHNGEDYLSRVLSCFANGVGTCVTVAVGNEGNARHHYMGNVSRQNGYLDEFELRVGTESEGFGLEIWVKAPKIFSIGFVSPTGEVVERIPARVGSTQVVDFIFEKTRLIVEYDIIESLSGDEVISVKFVNPTVGVWRIRVYGREQYSIDEGPYNCWLPITEFVGEDIFFLLPDPQLTATAPAMAQNVISVSAYNSDTGVYYLESGRGPTGDGLIKPDICAPGVDITGANLFLGEKEESGTSAAAAITAGACADLLPWAVEREKNTIVTTNIIKSYLIRGAVRRNADSYPNTETGYGYLNLYNTLEVLRNL